LVALVANASGYRATALSEENLEDILQGEVATAEQRLGAAIALRALLPSDDPAPRKRIRIVADRSANPSVRSALTEIAEADAEAAYLEAVEDALGCDERDARPALRETS